MRRFLIVLVLVCLLVMGWCWLRLWSGWVSPPASPTAAFTGVMASWTSTVVAATVTETITPRASATWTAIVTVMDTATVTATAWVVTPRPSSTVKPSLTPLGVPEADGGSGVVCRKVVEDRWDSFLLCKILGGR